MTWAISDALKSVDYWSNTPNVLSDAADAIGFAVRNPATVLFGKSTPSSVKPTADTKPVSFSDNSKEMKMASNVGNKVNLNPLSKNTVVRNDGTFVRQNSILNSIGTFNDTIDNTVSDGFSAIFGSATFWKYAIIAGGAFMAFKYGGELAAGGSVARSNRYRTAY